MRSLRLLQKIGICLIIGLAVPFLLSVQTASSVKVNSSASTPFTGVKKWYIETLSTIATGNSSITVDSNGYPRISYGADGTPQKLRYAQWTGSQWAKETVDSIGLGTVYPSLALDGSEYPHISYTECNMYSCPAKYAEWTGSSWSITENMDGHGSLALDASDDPHMSYGHGNLIGMTSLKYATRDTDVWILTTVDVDPISGYTSLKLDTSDHPHISYYKGDTLKYAYWSGSEWITQAVDSAYALGPGQNTSLALDAEDNPHIVYYVGDSQELRYAEWDGTGWINQTVDSTGDVGKYASLVLDSYGFAHIVYYDATNQAIKYAHQMGTRWRTRTVETDVGLGTMTSLAIGSDNRLHLSYYYYRDSTDQALRYAYGDVISYTHSVNLPLITVSDP